MDKHAVTSVFTACRSVTRMWGQPSARLKVRPQSNHAARCHNYEASLLPEAEELRPCEPYFLQKMAGNHCRTSVLDKPLANSMALSSRDDYPSF